MEHRRATIVQRNESSVESSKHCDQISMRPNTHIFQSTTNTDPIVADRNFR